MLKKTLIVFVILLCACRFSAQELNCTVQILTQQIQGDKKIYETLQKSIYEFMNNTKWTKDVFKSEERIECSMTINITSRSDNAFTATIQLQSRRPVYKSSYPSVLFNYQDDNFQFAYTEYQPLEFNENSNISNLTSVLAFYGYMFIGMDYDAFSLNGGTPYYQKASAIVNNAQSDNSVKGWKSSEGFRNRFWFVTNMLEPIYAPIRECNYKYHHLGLDIMYQNRDQGRAVIAESLELLRKVHKDKPASFNIQLFFNAKADELINIFSGSAGEEKTRVVNLLNEVDPANSNKYQKIMSAN